MSKAKLFLLVSLVLLVSASALAVDGVILLNQATATNGLGGCDTPGFPITICNAGSYRLTGNLVTTDANTIMIDITADNVSIDLNGFSILGPNTCSGSPFYGVPISCTVPFSAQGIGIRGNRHRNISISNGTIDGMGGAAIVLNIIPGLNYAGTSDSNSRIERVSVSNNRRGIEVQAGIVTHCTASLNYYEGIVIAYGTVSYSTSTQNLNGIIADLANSNLLGNTVSFNGFGVIGSPTTGYANNVITYNTTDVINGVSLGQNLCTNGPC